MKTLEERFGQAVRVTQACVEDLASGPKLAYGGNVGFMNFSEKLNAASRILHGDVEREASAATNLKRIVNRLPNDLIVKWQNENYEILKRGKTTRLKDIAAFVKKQASIRNDPVFGMQTLRRDIKDTRAPSKPTRDQHPPIRNPTINATNVGSKRHKLQRCPIVKQCDHVAVRRQYAASCGYCFNCGLERPGHGSGSCPDPSACSKCPGRHLTLLHTESNDSSRRPSTRNNVNLNDKRVKPSDAAPSPAVSKPSDAAPLASDKEENKVQNTIGNPDNKSGPTPISLARIATAQAQVLSNVVPVTITADNGKAVSTYAFLDNGCTDTLIDRELAEYLGLQGTPEQIGISTITDSENLVESNRVSFTLSSADGSGEDIHITDAYVLPDLNQSQRILPEEIDVRRYSHLQDIDFPAADIRRVSILWAVTFPMHTYRRRLESQKIGKGGSTAADMLLDGVSLVLMMLNVAKELQRTLCLSVKRLMISFKGSGILKIIGQLIQQKNPSQLKITERSR